jgi:hypothetical protein
MSCQVDAVVPANVSSPTATHHSKHITRKPITDRDQFNLATILFRKVADTISELAQSDFEEKMQLFQKIHDLIKEGKPVELMHSGSLPHTVPPTDSVLSPVVSTLNSTTVNKVNRT